MERDEVKKLIYRGIVATVESEKEAGIFAGTLGKFFRAVQLLKPREADAAYAEVMRELSEKAGYESGTKVVRVVCQKVVGD